MAGVGVAHTLLKKKKKKITISRHNLFSTTLFKNLNKLNFAVVMASLFTAGTDMLGIYFLLDLAVESEPWIDIA